MSSPEKEAPRFKSFPHEVRDKIYRYLLSAASHKCERTREFVTHWGPISQSTYVFDTAILRTNRNVSEEAYNVLYKDNPLVLLDFGTDNNCCLKTFILGNVAFIHVMEGSQLPPCPIRIRQQIHSRRDDGKTAVVVAATDLTGICAQISQQNVYHAFCDKEVFSLISLPQNGWTFKQLGRLIWLPLKALRDATFPGNEGRMYYKIKAIDCTDVSAETDEISDSDGESEPEGDTDVEYDDEGETEDDEQDATSQDSSGEKDSDSEQSLGEEANKTSTEQDGQPPDDSDESDVEASGENAEEELESGKTTGNQFDETMDSDTNNHKLARLPVYHSTQPSNQVPLGQPDPDELLLEPPPDRMHPGGRYFVLDCKITFSRW